MEEMNARIHNMVVKAFSVVQYTETKALWRKPVIALKKNLRLVCKVTLVNSTPHYNKKKSFSIVGT